MKALAFNAGNHDFLLDTDLILRITSPGQMFLPDDAPEFLRGIAKFRDRALPVITLRETEHATTDFTSKLSACFIILNGPLGPLGIHADATKGILDIDSEKLPSKENGRIGGTVTHNGADYTWIEVKDMLETEAWEKLECFLRDLP